MDKKLKIEYQVYLSELRKNAFIENKISSLPKVVVNNSKTTSPGKTVKTPPNRGEALADIPHSRKKRTSDRPLTREQKFSRFQTFEEKLRYYKQLRNSNRISEGEYQSKKQELLNRF